MDYEDDTDFFAFQAEWGTIYKIDAAAATPMIDLSVDMFDDRQVDPRQHQEHCPDQRRRAWRL